MQVADSFKKPGMHEAGHKHYKVEALFDIVVLDLQIAETTVIFDVVVISLDSPAVLVILIDLFGRFVSIGLECDKAPPSAVFVIPLLCVAFLAHGHPDHVAFPGGVVLINVPEEDDPMSRADLFFKVLDPGGILLSGTVDEFAGREFYILYHLLVVLVVRRHRYYVTVAILRHEGEYLVGVKAFVHYELGIRKMTVVQKVNDAALIRLGASEGAIGKRPAVPDVISDEEIYLLRSELTELVASVSKAVLLGTGADHMSVDRDIVGGTVYQPLLELADGILSAAEIMQQGCERSIAHLEGVVMEHVA